jgi:hypothetical protein
MEFLKRTVNFARLLGIGASCLFVLFLSMAAMAADAEQDWIAYRAVYPRFVAFRDQSLDYPLLRLNLKVSPRRQAQFGGPLVLRLMSASTNQQLPIGQIGVVEPPISPIAFDEDGVLRLNRPKGSYSITTQYSIKVRTDSRYSMDWLHAACKQGFAIKKTLGFSHRLALIGKSCVGVTFQFQTPEEPVVMFKAMDGTHQQLKAEKFQLGHNTPDNLTFVRFRFNEWPTTGELIAKSNIGLIDFIFE